MISEPDSNYAGSEIEEVRRFPSSPHRSVPDLSVSTNNNSAVFKKVEKRSKEICVEDADFSTGLEEENQTPKKKDPRHSKVKFKERED